MRVGLIAPPWVSVPPAMYGGTEVVVDILARGLVAAGDDVMLFATGDSTCPVRREWVYPRALGTAGGSVVAEGRQMVRAYEAVSECDVVHDHTLLGALHGVARFDGPVVTTAHGPFTEELSDIYAAIAERAAVVAISHHQRSTAPKVPIRAVIHHGIDVEQIPLGAGDGGYALFLGRMSPDKGAHRAIRSARAAGVPLVLAAKMWEPDERRYFEEIVEPMLDEHAVYIGEVGGTAKLELLGRAVALLNPIRWNEPFGLVMIEALATGTPVLSFAEGAAPEIVDDGVTGFVCHDEDAMAVALTKAKELSRDACRASALQRFSSTRMVADHRRLYRELLEEGTANVIDLHAPPSPDRSRSRQMGEALG